MSLLAIGWEPELRGLLTVIIGVVVLMGSIYMIMATNMGSRLSFLAAAEIDEAGQRQYVYMVRDLGAKRQPAVVLTIGGGAIFLALCYLLHRRERILQDNLSSAVATA